jgi:hypothetical protein
MLYPIITYLSYTGKKNPEFLGNTESAEVYHLNILGDRRHLDGLRASKMLAFPSFLR